MSKLSARLRLLREERGLSQSDMSRVIGKSKSSVNMYERGEREPGVEILEMYADYFNVDMNYLIGKSEIRNRYKLLANDSVPQVLIEEKNHPAPTERNEVVEEFIELFLKLTPEQQKMMLAQLKGLLDSQ